MQTKNKKLYRTEKDKMIAGVAGGLGKYFNVDPTLIRIIFVLLAFWGGAGLLFYLLLVFIIPKQGEKEAVAEEIGGKVDKLAGKIKKKGKELTGKRPLSKRKIAGLIILIIGAYLLLNAVFPFQFLRWAFFWPALIIVVGLYFIITK